MFREVIEAVRQVSGFDKNTNFFEVPSLALKLGHSLKRCATILKGNVIEICDEVTGIRAADFNALCDLNWTEEISTHDLRTINEKKRDRGC